MFSTDFSKNCNKLDINIVNTQNLSIELKNIVGDENKIGARAEVAMVLKS